MTSVGLNKYLFDMCNIRNQCSWVHKDAPEGATQKAKDLVRMSVAKVALLDPLTEPVLDIHQDALVIGGGVAGMEAAANLSAQGYHTYLVEISERLGGQARHLPPNLAGRRCSGVSGGAGGIGVGNDRQYRDLHPYPHRERYGFCGKLQYHRDRGRCESRDLANTGVTIFALGASEYKPAGLYLYGGKQAGFHQSGIGRTVYGRWSRSFRR